MNRYKIQKFNGETIYVGMDTHLKDWMISIFHKELELKTFTQPPDCLTLMSYLKRNYPGAKYKCVYEAGFSGFSIQRELTALGAECIVAHPADVPTTEKEKRYKNDRRDSRKLGRSLRSEDLHPIYIPDEQQEHDRALLRTRDRITRNITRSKNRIKSLLKVLGKKMPEEFEGKCWSKKFLGYLKEMDLNPPIRKSLDTYISELEHLKELKKQLNQQVRAMAKKERYAENLRLLRKIPSIGFYSAMVFLTEIGDINRFKKFKSLCCYFGLIPNMRSSSSTIHVGRLTRRGNKYLKYILIECAWIAMRKDPALLMSYQSAIIHTEPNKAIIKVARKLLNRIRLVLKYKTEYVTGIAQQTYKY